VRAAVLLNVACVTASGGVTCNRALRRELAAACARRKLQLRLADPGLCTDNAAMIGILAERKFRRQTGAESLREEILPNWDLSTSGDSNSIRNCEES